MNIVCVSYVQWRDELQQRVHHVMTGLWRRGATILVIDPPDIHGRKIFGSLYRQDANLFIYNLSVLGYLLDKLKLRPLYKTIDKLTRKLELQDPILWLIHPAYPTNSAALVESLKPTLTVYDCIDNWPEISSKRHVALYENNLVAVSDIVFAVSEELVTKVRSKRTQAEIYLVPNAADVSHFSGYSDWIPTADFFSVDRPTVGFFGALSKWIDLELVRFLIERHPEWNFMFVGPAAVDVESLQEIKNAYFLGSKPYSELPRYVAAFDVCIIPFKVNELTRDADPIKLYEYMATGKPIVSTDLPASRRFKDVVKIASGYEEFEHLIAEGLLEEDDALALKRVQIAKENTWDSRCELIEQIIQQLQQKRAASASTLQSS